MAIKKSSIVHPKAFVHPGAQLGEYNVVGPFSYIGENVIIGDKNQIRSHACIGSDAEHRTERSTGGVVIGSHNSIHEFTTVNNALSGRTHIASDCYIMRGVHIGHDAIIEEKVTLSCNTIVGGHSYIQRSANCGLGTIIHQKRAIGAFSMVGMGSIVTKSIPPFVTAMGAPCKPTKINQLGLVREGIPQEHINDILKWYESNYTTEFSEQYYLFVRRWLSMKEKLGGK
jgi:UDP-N-acetylglucosamine acyltransferase